MSDTWTIEANDAGVRAWSSFRQPFEPRDERLRYRTMLQAALRNVQRGSSSPLRAAYVSENTSFCDAENILFYNVGSGAFSGLLQRGLVFERAFIAPPLDATGQSWPHYCSWRLDDGLNGFDHWLEDGALADFSLPGATPPKLAATWAAIHAGEPTIAATLPAGRFFGLELKLADRRAPNVTTLKVILDGVISAFHADDGNGEAMVLERVAAAATVPVEQARAMLANRDRNVLGARRLAHLFRGGIQWNPADDRCVAVRITMGVDDAPGSNCLGRLFAVTAA